MYHELRVIATLPKFCATTGGSLGIVTDRQEGLSTGRIVMRLPAWLSGAFRTEHRISAGDGAGDLAAADGSSSERFTQFVLEGASWKHELTQDEYALFPAPPVRRAPPLRPRRARVRRLPTKPILPPA
jgi:hypothetical protein